jgi:hypothetical protein
MGVQQGRQTQFIGINVPRCCLLNETVEASLWVPT